jgi:ribosome-associated protein
MERSAGGLALVTITNQISLNMAEIKFTFTASPGPGGQNVNKVATAVLLRFDVLHSPSLPEDVRTRLITALGKKLTNQVN